MFRLITTMKQGTASDLAPAVARYPTVEAVSFPDRLTVKGRLLRFVTLAPF
jgi:hypothetical protein